jgi:hypothetical protein
MIGGTNRGFRVMPSLDEEFIFLTVREGFSSEEPGFRHQQERPMACPGEGAERL